VIIDGFYSDAAVTYSVGTPSAATKKLLDVTEASLYKAIQQAQVGGRLGDISAVVQEMCEAEGFGVVREFVGHGIGRSMHEDPQVPNFGARGKGPRLKAGMVLAIEPMINAGGPEVKVLPDGWTTITLDGSYSAHFEHTVAITKDGPQVLTR
jgi:methionyl aminopeptidase